MNLSKLDFSKLIKGYIIINNSTISGKQTCLPRWKVSFPSPTKLTHFAALVEYWRNRYQRMNKERFVAANVMAIVTHGIVS